MQKINISLEVKLPYNSVGPSVGRLIGRCVGWSVCLLVGHNILKGGGQVRFHAPVYEEGEWLKRIALGK